MLSAAYASLLPPKPTFSVNDIPDLTGQVIIVTGGNSGIGKETVKALLIHGAKVYIAARDTEKISRTIEALREETGKEAHALVVDLSDLESIKKAAIEFQTKETQLHVLINNAGVMYPDISMLTKDGYDLQFGTNVLGHFYLTKLLMPLLLQTASSAGKVRVINISSLAHFAASGIEYDTMRDEKARRKKGTVWLYGQSKFGNILVSNELHRRYGSQGVVSIAVHPGSINTELMRHTGPLFRFCADLVLRSPAMGALTQLYAATMPQALDYGGKYMIPWARLGKVKKETNDVESAKALWDWLEEQVKEN